MTLKIIKHPKVVVVGGSFGGLNVAKALDSWGEVVLVEKQERFFHNPGALRAAVDATWLDKLFIPYDSLLKHGRVLRARAVEITPQAVKLNDGTQLEFDYLVLATGSTYPFPAKLVSDEVAPARQAVQQLNQRVAQAKSVLLVGGGPVGIELAGEIITAYPDKTVTLLESQPRLLGNFNPALGARLTEALAQLGVQLRLGERLNPSYEPTEFEFAALRTAPPIMQTYLTNKGTQLEADLILSVLA